MAQDVHPEREGGGGESAALQGPSGCPRRCAANKRGAALVGFGLVFIEVRSLENVAPRLAW